MRVPVSLLRKLAPVQDADGPVSVERLATVMNDRVSEVEHVHRLPTRADLAGFRIERGAGDPAVGGQLVVVDADGKPATEARLGIGVDSTNPVTLGPDVGPAFEAGDADLFDVLELDDQIIEFDLEPNRPDLFSLAGMARDAAAIWDAVLRLPDTTAPAWPAESSVRIAVEDDERVPRYIAVEVEGVEVGPSPQWLQNAVRKLGMRPINNVVDATNLVMLELGEPMHTFDRSEIQSGVIGLRMAKPGEKLTTLDGVERTLTDECILVVDGDPADGGGVPVALAGIMGSEGSGVTAATKSLLIEAASFDMSAVRRASRRLALRTEASLRFEKGLPQHGVDGSVARLVALLQQVGGPDVRVVGHTEHWPKPPADRVIPIDPERLRQRLAMDLSPDRIDQILGRSGCKVERRHDAGAPPGHWRVTLPHHRPDLAIPEDLEEEVGRIQGYEHVDSELPVARLSPVPHNPVFAGASAVRSVLTGWGLDEVYLSPWISDAEVTAFGLPAPGEASPLVVLENPLNQDLKYFRPSALPAVVAAVRENRKQQATFGLFEVGQVWHRGDDHTIVEGLGLAGALLDPKSQAVGGAFYRVRDALVDLGRRRGLRLAVSREPADALPTWAAAWLLHPGRSAVLRAADGTLVAVLGELHPGRARDLDLRDAPVVFTADLDAIERLAARAGVERFVPPPRFPGVEAHVNVVAPDRLLAADLLARIDAEHLVDKDVLDVWAGKGVPDGKRRLTLALQFNHPDRSLTHEEVASRLAGIQQALEADSSLSVELSA